MGLGRDDVKTADSFVRACQLRFESAVGAIAMLGQLAQRHAEWAQKLEKVEVTKPYNVPAAEAASIDYHDFWRNPDPQAPREWRCRQCNVVARADHALRADPGGELVGR